eukprot:3873493-Prymnesium_polylepis.1
MAASRSPRTAGRGRAAGGQSAYRVRAARGLSVAARPRGSGSARPTCRPRTSRARRRGSAARRRPPTRLPRSRSSRARRTAVARMSRVAHSPQLKLHMRA